MTNRLLQVKKLLAQNNVDAALVSSIPNIIFLTNFAYFTEIEREAFILITKKNNYIFTDARYSHAVKKYLPNFSLAEISVENSFINLLQTTVAKENIKNLGIEEDNLTVSEYKKISLAINKTKHFDLRNMRSIKGRDEIKKINEACKIGDRTFAYILKQFKLGISEKEIAFLLEAFMRQQGCEPSFPSIVAFGENAAVPHHKTGNKKLTANNFILLDFGINYEHYCSDMTRTIFFGNPNQQQQKIYNTVLTAQQKTIEYIEECLKNKQPVQGIVADKTAREYILGNEFPVFSHGLGHGVGLQVHEAPRLSPLSKDILANGMVFSIEPGIYLPDNLGVRIEDLFAIQNNQLTLLTKAPKTFIQL